MPEEAACMCVCEGVCVGKPGRLCTGCHLVGQN